MRSQMTCVETSANPPTQGPKRASGGNMHRHILHALHHGNPCALHYMVMYLHFSYYQSAVTMLQCNNSMSS